MSLQIEDQSTPAPAEPEIAASQGDSQEVTTKRRRSGPAEWWPLALETVGVIAAFGVLVYFQPSLLQTIGAFIITLGILVFVHEWGHYQFALWAGMKVNRFAIGFPPWIFTRRRNGIDYSIGALPIGGMVDISGLGSEEEMVAVGKNKVAKVSGEETPGGITLVPDESFKNGSSAGTSPAKPDNFEHYRLRNPDAPHGKKQFQDASLGWRFLTLFAGPMMNFLFAIVVFIGVFSIAGLPNQISSYVDEVLAGKPAAIADIRKGDQIVGVNETTTTNVEEIQKLIKASDGQPVTLLVKRDNNIIAREVTPIVENDPVEGRVARVGIQFTPAQDFSQISYTKVGLGEAIQKGFISAFSISYRIVDMIRRAATFSLTKEEREGVGGPVRIASEVGKSAQGGWQGMALFTAMLSVNLGLLNLLPFPALDGGRILFLAYEFVARKPLDPRKEGLVHAVGMVMLLAFMLFITIRDIWPYIAQSK